MMLQRDPLPDAIYYHGQSTVLLSLVVEICLECAPTVPPGGHFSGHFNIYIWSSMLKITHPTCVITCLLHIGNIAYNQMAESGPDDSHGGPGSQPIPATNAINGNINPILTLQNCAYARNPGSEEHPWWKVMFGAEYVIRSVTVFVREDDDCKLLMILIIIDLICLCKMYLEYVWTQSVWFWIQLVVILLSNHVTNKCIILYCCDYY